MHAFLIIGSEKENLPIKVRELAESKCKSVFEFPILKIADVRILNKFLKLSFSKKTAILINNIEEATLEALNAFLKNLEEPQENITFFLTSFSENKVIPTITSRCQVIRLKVSDPKKIRWDNNALKFLEAGIGQRLLFISSINKKEEAKEFLEKIIYLSHEKIHSENTNLADMSLVIKNAQITHNRLKLNGNVGLQLTNFVMNLEINRNLPKTAFKL